MGKCVSHPSSERGFALRTFATPKAASRPLSLCQVKVRADVYVYRTRSLFEAVDEEQDDDDDRRKSSIMRRGLRENTGFLVDSGYGNPTNTHNLVSCASFNPFSMT